MSRAYVRRLLWLAAGLLAAIGVVSAVGRALEVTHPTASGFPSAADSVRAQALAAVMGAPPRSEAYREAERQVAELTARFNANPRMALLHVVPGLLLLTLPFLQFSARLRSRFPAVHRWSGRLLLLTALPVGLSGLFFGVLKPYTGLSEAVPSAVFGALFFTAGYQAWAAIRRRDIPAHREWVIRWFALVLGVGSVRLVGVGLVARGFTEPAVVIGRSFWLGWLLTLGVAELWIRATRRTVPAENGWRVPLKPEISQMTQI